MNTSEKPVRESSATLKDLLSGNESVFPSHLNADFPRIVKKICVLWDDPVSARQYFQELLLTKRENRQGFPFDIHQEIFALSNHYSATHPLKSRNDEFWGNIYFG